LILANNIANSKEEEPISPTYLGEGMTKKKWQKGNHTSHQKMHKRQNDWH
jgi:hypothetical protein